MEGCPRDATTQWIMPWPQEKNLTHHVVFLDPPGLRNRSVPVLSTVVVVKRVEFVFDVSASATHHPYKKAVIKKYVALRP